MRLCNQGQLSSCVAAILATCTQLVISYYHYLYYYYCRIAGGRGGGGGGVNKKNIGW